VYIILYYIIIILYYNYIILYYIIILYYFITIILYYIDGQSEAWIERERRSNKYTRE